jgi:ADP-ribosylglycohydrolase
MSYEKYKTRYKTLKSFLNSLYGAIVGDAYGIRYEFMSEEKASEQIKKDGQQILGSLIFDYKIGQISDKSELMIMNLNNLEYKQEIAAKNYIKWYNTNPLDISKTVKNALNTQYTRAENNQDMISNSNNMNKNAISNGSMTRLLAILLYNPENKLQNIIDLDCDLTHPNIIVKNIILFYGLFLKNLLDNMSPDDIYHKLIKDHRILPRTKIHMRDAYQNKKMIYIIDHEYEERYIRTDDKRYQGYIGITFQNALIELFNNKEKSLMSSLMNIASRGGDTSTNCFVAGSLLGLYYKDIPKKLVDQVMNLDIDRYKKYLYLSPKNINNIG